MRPETRRRVGREVALVLRGQWPMSCVNPDVLPRPARALAALPDERWYARALTPMRQVRLTCPNIDAGAIRRGDIRKVAGDRQGDEGRGGRDPLRLSGEPADRGGGGGGHPHRHRAPGAYGPAHGRRLFADDVRRQDRRLLHAARPGRGERLRRRGPGVLRVRADPRGPRRATPGSWPTTTRTSTRP